MIIFSYFLQFSTIYQFFLVFAYLKLFLITFVKALFSISYDFYLYFFTLWHVYLLL